jgi:prepilin-type N-terminal cleavage/methylation domain-containing protein
MLEEKYLSHQTPRCFSNKRRGFTIVELIGVLVILGILAVLVVPVVRGFRESANDKAAISVATALDAAKMNYRDRVPNAQAIWVGKNDAEKYALLKASDCLPMSAPTLTGFSPSSDYTFAIGELLAQTTVKKNGTIIYPK